MTNEENQNQDQNTDNSGAQPETPKVHINFDHTQETETQPKEQTENIITPKVVTPTEKSNVPVSVENSATENTSKSKIAVPQANSQPVEQVPNLTPTSTLKNTTDKNLEQTVKSNSLNQVSPKKFLITILSITLFFIFVFYLILLWSYLSGDANNPIINQILEQVGGNQEKFKDLLLRFTTFFFGTITLIFFVLGLVNIFGALTSPKHSLLLRSKIKFLSVFFVLFLLSVSTWIVFFRLIDGNIVTEEKTKDLIATIPQNVIGLQSPVKISFDVGKALYKQIDRKNIVQILWDFGDPNSDKENFASGDKVVHTFKNKGDNDGRFPVVATIRYLNENGKEQGHISTKNIIVANEKVIAEFSASPETGEVPLELILDASESYDPDGNIVKYEWDLDGDADGIFEASGKVVDHTIFDIGEHLVRLRVSGTNNDASISEKVIKVVSPKSNLRAEISSIDGFEGIVPFQVTLDGSNSFVREGQIVKYEWIVEGENETSSGRQIKRIFRKPGKYEIRLTVENDLGQRSIIKKLITVLPLPKDETIIMISSPKINKEGMIYGVAPLEASFDVSKSVINNPIDYEWDFNGDGINDEVGLKAVSHTYETPGTYEMSVTISNSFGERTTQKQTIVVERAGVQSAIKATPSSGVVPLEVTFDASQSKTDRGEIINYIWKFPGKEPIPYGGIINYEFKKIGTYEVFLTTETSLGESKKTSQKIIVRSPLVRALFETNLDKNLTVQFSGANSEGVITDYQWEFGDGNSGVGPTTAHKYLQPGTYRVKLKITDQRGIISQIEKELEVKFMK